MKQEKIEKMTNLTTTIEKQEIEVLTSEVKKGDIFNAGSTRHEAYSDAYINKETGVWSVDLYGDYVYGWRSTDHTIKVIREIEDTPKEPTKDFVKEWKTVSELVELLNEKGEFGDRVYWANIGGEHYEVEDAKKFFASYTNQEEKLHSTYYDGVLIVKTEGEITLTLEDLKPIEWEADDQEKIEKNEGRALSKGHTEFCACCGKGLSDKPKYWIETIQGPEVILPGFSEVDLLSIGESSQGAFCVGSTCRKKYPAAYVTKEEITPIDKDLKEKQEKALEEQALESNEGGEELPAKFIPCIEQKDGFVQIASNSGLYEGYIYIVLPGGKGERLKKSDYTDENVEFIQGKHKDSTPNEQATTEEIKEFFDRLTGADRLEEDQKKCFEFCFEPVVNQVKSHLSNFLFSNMKNGELAFDILDNCPHYHTTSWTPIDIIIDKHVEEHVEKYLQYAELDSIQNKIFYELNKKVREHFSGLLNA